MCLIVVLEVRKTTRQHVLFHDENASLKSLINEVLIITSGTQGSS